jgi:hypothetical protein
MSADVDERDTARAVLPEKTAIGRRHRLEDGIFHAQMSLV